MKKAMKGMIVFFSVLLVAISGLLVYALVRGDESVPFLSSIEDRFGGSGTLVATETVDWQDISVIDISAYSCDIRFKSTDSGDITLQEYAVGQAKKVQTMSADKNGSNLKITVDKQKVNNWVVFGSNYRYLEVYLPQDYIGAMKIKTSSGDVTTNMDFNCTEFSVKTSSGDLYLQELTADEIAIETSSGDVRAENDLKSGEFSAQTSSGYLYLGAVAAESISVQTNSGDVNADRFSGTAKVKCSSGYVKIKENNGDTTVTTNSGDVTLGNVTGSLDIQTSSGYVKADDILGEAQVQTSSGDVTLAFKELSGDLDIQTSSGYVRCNLPKDTGFEFTADTNSGDISTYFDGSLGYDKKGKKASGTVGVGSKQEVKVQTSSGDIKFRDK